MEKMEVWCGVYGERGLFCVEIERDADVEALRQTIVDHVRFGEGVRYSPADLKLFLARKDGKWIEDDNNVDILLQGEVDDQFEMMCVSRKLEDEGYFGKQFELGERKVHVLVKLPEPAVDEKGKIKDLSEIKETLKRKNLQQSEIDYMTGRELLRDLNLWVKVIHSTPLDTEDATSVTEPFKWEVLICSDQGQEVAPTDEQQRERIRRYLEDYIGVGLLQEQELCLFDAEKESDVLDAKIPGHDIKLFGHPDFLVLNELVSKDPFDLGLLPDVKMLVDVKKDFEFGDSYKTISRLIALDVLSYDPVVALMTDLTSQWVYFWVSDRSDECADIMMMALSEPTEAFAVIRALIAVKGSCATAGGYAAEISLPCMQTPMKR